ncbi:MAG: glycoside hydrolase domain-containing protein [Armatimonadota bacterium]
MTTRTADVTVKLSTRYLVTWWCRTEGMTRSRAYLWLQTNVAQRVIAGADQVGTRDWTQHFSAYITDPDETTIAAVLTAHDLGGEPAQAWFDDVAIYEGSFPAELDAIYQPLLRQAAGVSETALVLAEAEGLTLWADTLAVRIHAADGLPQWARPAEAVRVCAARGEEDFFQLALLPEAATPEVQLVPSELTGPATIPAAAVRWWPVGQANIRTAHRPQTRLGPTPDPLLKPAPRTAAAGENSVFCVAIAVPRDAAPGEYRGEVVVLWGERELARGPISLSVFGFTMPEDPSFRTLITFSSGSFRPSDNRPLDEIERDICTVLAEHGVRGHGAIVEVPATIEYGRVVCDFAPVDPRISWVMEELGFNAFFLGPMVGGGTSEGWEKHRQGLGMEPLSEGFNRHFRAYMRQVGQHLREMGWLDKVYVYLWGEPEPDYFNKVVQLQQLALQGDPDLKIWETTSPANRAFWGVVKAWSVPFSPMHFEIESVEARRAAGDEIWVYNAPATQEAAPQIHRLGFWGAARYGARGAQLCGPPSTTASTRGRRSRPSPTRPAAVASASTTTTPARRSCSTPTPTARGHRCPACGSS